MTLADVTHADLVTPLVPCLRPRAASAASVLLEPVVVALAALGVAEAGG